MDDQARYLARLLDGYRRLPGTLGRVLRDDRRIALTLYRQRIALDIVHQAFILATARRAFAVNHASCEPIRTLRYFLPLIDEIVTSPPDPAYLIHLQHRLHDAGLDPPI